jgi:hypothetical protein
LASPLAVLVRPDGRVLWADESSLHLSDGPGEPLASLPFEPPLFRQGYRLLMTPDGRHAVLHTPWFIQAFDPDLKALGPRLRYEDVGHYMKHAVLSADGSRVYTAGALLLDPEEGGAGMEARWDAWDLEADAWRPAWKGAYQSYNNSHLRGLQLSDDGQRLCVELYQEGYEFHIYDAEGRLLWKRAGEHPVLSGDGALLLWESHFDGVVLSRIDDQSVVYKHGFEEKVRLKAVQADGHALVLAGRHCLVLGPDGRPRWDAWFKTDPYDLGLGPQGRLVVIRQDRAAILALPWPAA